MAKPTTTLVKPTRREALFGLGAGLGSVALTSLVHAEQGQVHHAARAKRCIFLTMEGGPSHIDTFDPKPELAKYAGKPLPTPHNIGVRQTEEGALRPELGWAVGEVDSDTQ